MVQILRQPNYWAEALGTGLNELAQGKINQLQKRKSLDALMSLGLSPEEARGVSGLDPMVQREFLKQRMQAPQQQAYAQALQSMLSGGQQMEQPQSQGSGQEIFNTSGASNTYKDSLGETREMPPSGSPPDSIIPAGLTQQQATELTKIGLNQKNLERKMSAAEQKEIRKEVLPYIKEVQEKASASKENDMRLNKMEELIKSGKLNNPVFSSALKSLSKGVLGIGIDLTSFLSPESQEFEKLSNDFLKSIKEVFGSRISNLEVDNFLKTVPTLSQSNEGKASVIGNLKLLNQAAQVKRDVAKGLIDKYGSKLPLDFRFQVEELAKPKLDELAEEFGKIYKGVGDLRRAV